MRVFRLLALVGLALPALLGAGPDKENAAASAPDTPTPETGPPSERHD